MPLSESRLAVLAAARYWRATQAVKGVPTQAIEHAHRCLVRAVDAYAAELKRAETTPRERGGPMAERPDLERLQQHASGEDFNACSCWQCPDVGADVRTLIDYTLATEARLDAALPVLEAARAQAVWFRERNPALWDESEAKALMAAVETWEAGA